MHRNSETHLKHQTRRRLPGRTGLRAVLAGALVLVGGLIGGGVVAAQWAAGIPPGIWNQLKFGSNDLLVVFAVDSQGNVKPYYEKDVGKPADWENIPNPHFSPWVQIQIGNPKVCWIASDGSRECVVY